MHLLVSLADFGSELESDKFAAQGQGAETSSLGSHRRGKVPCERDSYGLPSFTITGSCNCYEGSYNIWVPETSSFMGRPMATNTYESAAGRASSLAIARS